ncbi:MAG: hypothetical protein OER56_16335 [Hyphomicrobiales bacterium]|nr:hypothetical protein [Hyphomicrobiales bacterium]
MHRVMRRGPLILLLVLLAGCVSRIDDGTEVHIRYEYWMPLLQFAGGIAAIVAGLAITWRIRWGLILGGLFCAGWLAPTTALTGAWVTADGFIIRNGTWGMTATADLSFDDIASVREITKKSLGSRAQITYTAYLRFQLAGGGTVDVPVANDVLREAKKDILQRLAARRQAGG